MGGMSLQVAQVHYQILRERILAPLPSRCATSRSPTQRLCWSAVAARPLGRRPLRRCSHDVFLSDRPGGREQRRAREQPRHRYRRVEVRPAPATSGYDQNFDGVINSIDIGIMASHFNKFVTQCP